MSHQCGPLKPLVRLANRDIDAGWRNARVLRHQLTPGEQMSASATSPASGYSPLMSGAVHAPCAALLGVAEAIEQMITQYCVALRSVAAVGKWEAPQEGLALGWLLIRNVEAVILMARHDEVLVTASWPNSRAAFELSARIIWMLQPDDRYAAECRWLALLGDWEKTERKLVEEAGGRQSHS